jgi:HAD superfamily hydrolase (TIGR01509 family)
VVRHRLEFSSAGLRSDVSRLLNLLTQAEAILFDFDGPLCDVFAGMPASGVARQLETVAGQSYATDDPLMVLRECYRLCSRPVAERVEDELVRAEIAAVNVALAELGGIEALRAAGATGLLVAVVTNNAEEAASSFLHKHGLAELAPTVIGRAYRRPDLMKPNPWPLLKAAEALEVDPARAVLIGDSATDVEASCAAGLPCVAYANKPGKRSAFEKMNAAVIIDDMRKLASALWSRSHAVD